MKGRRSRFRCVGLVAKVTSPEALDLTRSLDRALKRRGLKTIFDSDTLAALGRSGGVPRDRMGHECDLILIPGGDGTLLSVARYAPSSTPILGINIGVLGFLTGLSREEALSRLDEVLAGKFREDRRRRLEVTIPSGRYRGVYRALNDVVMNRETVGRIATFTVLVEGRPISRFRGDGVIVATPTGSTAYSLSVGGPILHPSLAAVVVTPISPHSLTQRPLVVPASTTIGLAVVGRGPSDGVHLTLDGQERFKIFPGCIVEVRESGSAATLLRPPETDHFHKLAEKLNWGA